ncbi:sulfatase-like hydrolase/transferase [Stenotrophomonas acidaminiphila]
MTWRPRNVRWQLPELRAVCCALLYGVLPNLPFWVVAHFLKVDRPYIVLDYLVSAALFAYGWRRSAAVLLTLSLLADGLSVQGLVYPVLHPADILYLVSLLPYAPPGWQFVAVGTFLALMLMVGASWYFARVIDRLAALLLLGLAVLGYAVQSQMDPHSSEFERDKSSVFGSQLAYYANTRATLVLDSLFESLNPLYPIGFRDEVSSWAGKGDDDSRNFLLIVVESWGQMRDSHIRDAMLQPLLAERDQFQWLKTGEASGDHATVEAELRYLCGLGARYLNLESVTEGFENCLPWQLKARGYTTLAIHAADGGMHARKFWYPRAGFDKILFQDTAPWTTHCHSFPGACDREIMASTLPGAFARKNRQFVYWMTLNTHAPYDERDLWMDAFNCAEYQLPEPGDTCRLGKLHAQFFQQLAQFLAQPEMRGTEVFIVGDHSPPILDQDEFRRNFVDGRVPYVHLRVK